MSNKHHDQHGARMHGTRTIAPKAKGQHKITFKEGGLHASLGAKAGAKLTPAQHAKAASGSAGPKAKKQEMFYENVLKH